MDARSLGTVIGAVLIFLVVFTAFLFVGKKRRKTEHYDERQMAVRGKGYQYTSLTMLIALFLYGSFYGFLKDIVSPQFVVFTIAFIGVVTYSIYCIINDAYLQVGQSSKKWMLLITFVIFANLFSAFNSSETGLTANGFATGAALNIMIVVSFAVVLITMLIKSALDKRGDSDEES
ncbi:hypothetical protein [Pseudobutyrivibrio xylanivorans]|uniref:DUF2178 domain-containing protein n=1 Tax=Pseudobutyrivibrio xylanivorans TaxID=185007 RepID=A0A1G5S5E3_PSEXY|nr:hypothetical protein [Pseudobutyrivibrio xylanivorans]SCZ81574.1 hypothetical protein SAMN02910350_02886 [Pseudobutyrivibrio xylanivorans]